MIGVQEPICTDVLIIGSGIAGGTTALKLSEDPGISITVVTKAEQPAESSTYYAQGGIIYTGPGDSPELLTADLLRAGDGIGNPAAVDILAREGPELVRRILVDELHVPFGRTSEDELEPVREAAHSTARIAHVADTTGKSIEEHLIAAMRKRSNITFMPCATAVDLLTPAHHSRNRLAIYEPLSCVGAYLYDQTTCQVRTCLARCVVLATGGLGQVFLHSTNPEVATGDGLAMAYRAGARIVNAEYVQFHPTAFYHDNGARFLVTEAARGAGGRLTDSTGRPFMDAYSPEWKDLAPRDEVARAIHREMLDTGAHSVYLDFRSYIPREVILDHFPGVRENCLEYGIDPLTDLVPVVPAAHYSCGGVWVDEFAHTNLRNLYAVGEVSCTGVHGANRLGSASLLEGLVWANRAARDIARVLPETPLIDEGEIPPWHDEGLGAEADPALLQHDMATIKHIMWYYVGLVRTSRRLQRALADLNTLREDIDHFYRTVRVNRGLIGLRHSALAALIVARAAWENKESRGCHYRED